jgi:hypothetical protein
MARGQLEVAYGLLNKEKGRVMWGVKSVGKALKNAVWKRIAQFIFWGGHW